MVFYCYAVIFIKACLQIVLCLLTKEIEPKTVCILVEIFGIDCRTLPSVPVNSDDPLRANSCAKDGGSEDVGLVWDVFCFIVLLIQRRIYMSYMFQHVVNEYKAQSTLAAR